MMTTRMYGSQRPMVNLLFPRIQGMSLSDVELRLDYILIRDEAGEYLEESKLKDLVKRYSEFINFPPIHLWASKEVETEVPVEEDESTLSLQVKGP
ncbi:hypothetical protein Bca101_053651 [Brassica carinata]